MADTISPARRSANMAAIRSRDTGPELAVRRALRSLGVGYRLNVRGLPGRPDIVMKGRGAVIFVHGCFWHRHSDCRFASMPKSRVNFWQKKFADNVARDHKNKTRLHDGGWRVLVLWECETANAKLLKERVADFVNRGADAPSGRAKVRKDASAAEDRATAKRKTAAGP
jgi:DNA mismatch endonuclease, patch repair protein